MCGTLAAGAVDDGVSQASLPLPALVGFPLAKCQVFETELTTSVDSLASRTHRKQARLLGKALHHYSSIMDVAEREAQLRSSMDKSMNRLVRTGVKQLEDVDENTRVESEDADLVARECYERFEPGPSLSCVHERAFSLAPPLPLLQSARPWHRSPNTSRRMKTP